MPAPPNLDNEYLEILLKRIRVCRSYKPKFGQGQSAGLSLEQFQTLYNADPFYTWFGLDSPLMYAAHKAAGGITSIYRQIGTGCEELCRQILQDHLGLSPEQVTWAYEIPLAMGRVRTLSLDARIQLEDIRNSPKHEAVAAWLRSTSHYLNVAPEIGMVLKGAVFEVRQGYKSKDSKRQNADIANAATAYAQGFLPVVLVLSTQIDNDIVYRYQAERWLILRGFRSGAANISTYTFFKEVIGYDLAAFFEQHTRIIKETILDVLETLLSTHD